MFRQICSVALSLAAVLVASCTNTIHPPEVPAESRVAYLVDLGRHTRLALSQPDGVLIEYAYG